MEEPVPACLLVAAGRWGAGNMADRLAGALKNASVLGANANDPLRDKRGLLEQTKSSVLNQEVKHSHFRRNSWIEVRVWRKLNVKASRPREATESQSSKS